MNTEVAQVVEGKSKSRRRMIGAALAIVIAVLAYKNFDVIKPAANQAYDSLKLAMSSAAPEAASTAAPAVTLDKARLAFTNGDIQGSLVAYQEYIARDAGNLDARGELGNVYYLSGNYQEAAQTYYDLSKMLIDQKKIDLVPALLPVIGQVNPGLVDELMQNMALIQQQMYDAQVGQSSRQG